MAKEINIEKKKRIKQILVKNLFGAFNHTIPLHSDERITIIHGPNGFGKTMILKLLNALFTCNDYLPMAIPFDEFHVDFDDGTSFWIIKENQEDIESTALSDIIVTQNIKFCMTDKDTFISTLMYFLHNNNPIDVELIGSIRRTTKLIKTLTFLPHGSLSEDLQIK